MGGDRFTVADTAGLPALAQAHLRVRFRDTLGTTPSAYRRTFQRGSDVPERHATP
ncbi:hypothetical protein [Streptomyces sp. OE57]|uniref:hypothetical protein n=1 Tax=Streptomyces lacaronensis TaxID=3379885 RepID=UPI0039B736AC